MSETRLTQADLNKLPDAKGEPYVVAIKETPRGYSLQVRVAPTGKRSTGVRSIVVVFRVDGKQRRKTVCTFAKGQAPGIADIQKRVRAIIDEAKAGASGPVDAPTTIRELGDAYLALRATNTTHYPAYADGGRAARRAIARAEECWRDKPLEELTVGDAKRLVDQVTENQGASTARQVRGLLIPMLKYARDDLEMRGVRPDIMRATKIAAYTPRTVVFTPDERRRFFQALDDYQERSTRSDVAAESCDCIRLVYACAARQGEWFKAQWKEVDLEEGTWLRPAAKRKQRTDHRMILPDAAIAILRRQRERLLAEGRRVEGDAWVFPGRAQNSGTRPTHRQSIRDVFNIALERAGIEKELTPHDALRASRVTEWNREHGIDFFAIGRLIGSSPELLAKVYGRDPDTPEETRARFSTADDALL